jgi:hypothetical protein
MRTHFVPLVPDSTLASYGLAVQPDSVELVSSSALCGDVITAHNAHAAITDSTTMVTDSAMVARVGTSFLLALPPESGKAYLTFVYDSTLAFKTIIEQLD